MDRYLITVQAIVTLALMGFALFMYTVVGGAGADSIGSLIVGAVVTHWFKESAQIARTAAGETTKDMKVKAENVDVTETGHRS